MLRWWIGFFVGNFFIASSGHAAVPPTIDELLDLPSLQRGAASPAELSLLCARGLPGGHDVASDQCLAALAQWTDLVRAETEQRLTRLPQGDHLTRAALETSSPSRCKAQALLQTLHDMLGSDRQPASLEDGTLEAAVATGHPLDPRDLFLGGILEPANSPHRPTSVSLPWLYLAVGRRLGYPLRLAAQDGRLLLRWEGQNEQFTLDWQRSWTESPVDAPALRFNVEHPGGQLPFAPSDQVPPPSPSPMHLLTADDELAMLLSARGACLESHGQNREALVAYAQAHRLSPECDNYLLAIAQVMPKISALFGHTEPLAAPDYSDRGGPLEEIDAMNRFNMQRRQDDEARLRQVTEENRRILKARQEPRNNLP